MKIVHNYFMRCRRRKRPRRPVTALFLFGPVVGEMPKAVLHADDTSVTASIVLLDKKGNTATAASPPTWTMGADGVVSMIVADDGMSAEFSPAGVGDVTIDVLIEGDPEPGVDTIHATGDISVIAAEAATAEMTFGPVT